MSDWLEQFTQAHPATDSQIIENLHAYADWRTGRGIGDAFHGEGDELDIRAYLLQIRNEGADRNTIKKHLSSLKAFYGWAVAEGLAEETPFELYNFERPILTLDDLQKRHQSAHTDDPQVKEIAHLGIINAIAEQLNSTSDLQGALRVTLTTLVESMHLRTAWLFLTTETHLHQYSGGALPLHRYGLAAWYGLPPGLEREDYYYLRCPPTCLCQWYMDTGRLRRAANIVECSRLSDSAEADGDNAELMFHASVPLTVSGRTLGILNVAADEWLLFSSDDLNLLTTASAIISAALDRTQHYEIARAQRLRMEKELSLAQKVQASLIPAACPTIEGYGLASYWQPAREVAGDYFDVYPLADGQWGIVIADVSDKGAHAALYMALVSSFLKATAPRLADPVETLRLLNEHLVTQTSAEMFVSVWYGILDTQSNQIRYSIAGHDPPLKLFQDGKLEKLKTGGLILGLFKEVPLHELTLDLGPEDGLVLYTDGVTDAENADRVQFGMARLRETLKGAISGDAEMMVARVAGELRDFIGDAPQADDITLIVLKRDDFSIG